METTPPESAVNLYLHVAEGQNAERQWRLEKQGIQVLRDTLVAEGQNAERQWRQDSLALRWFLQSRGRRAERRKAMETKQAEEAGAQTFRGRRAERRKAMETSRSSNLQEATHILWPKGRTPKGNGDPRIPTPKSGPTWPWPKGRTPKGNGDPCSHRGDWCSHRGGGRRAERRKAMETI